MHLTPDPDKAKFDYWKKCSAETAAAQFKLIMMNGKNGSWSHAIMWGEE